MQPNKKGALEYIQAQLEDESLFSSRSTAQYTCIYITSYVHGLENSGVISADESQKLLGDLKIKAEEWYIDVPANQTVRSVSL